MLISKWDIITLKIFLSVIIVFLSAGSSISSEKKPQNFFRVESLDPQSDQIKSLRNDIRSAIITVKKNADPESLPELRFYKYTLKRDDNFWKILSRTTLNIDTLSTVNALSSPSDIFSRKDIYLSNMRGIIYKVSDKDSIEGISKKFGVSKLFICRVNKITEGAINKDYLFIPLGEISNIERSLFLGTGFASPLDKVVRTSNFGRRLDPFNKHIEFHPGVDLACPIGSSVYASRKGKVVFTGYEGGYGLLLILKHELGYSTYYGHLKKVLKKPGDFVERGDKIALSGETGRVTGPHLHFEVRKEAVPVNPGVLLK